MITIYCVKNKGKHDFYLCNGSNEYYLFSQPMKRSVDCFFRGRINLDKALCHGIGKKDHAIHHTMDKLKIHIRYLEKQHDIILLKKTYRKTREQLKERRVS